MTSPVPFLRGNKAKPDEAIALYWGDKKRMFSLTALVESNHSIRNVDYGQ